MGKMTKYEQTIFELNNKKRLLEKEIANFVQQETSKFTKQTGIQPRSIQIEWDNVYEMGYRTAKYCIYDVKIELDI